MRLMILIILLSIILISCNNEVIAKFEVSNDTEINIDSISVSSFEHQKVTNYINLKTQETKIYFLNMTKLPKVDGEYFLSLKKNMKIIKKRFGYFTNGYPMEELTRIQIKEDTIIIDFDKLN